MTVLQEQMPFRSRRRIPPMQSFKHVIDADGTLATGVSAVVPLSDGVNIKTGAFPTQTITGEVINGIFVTIFIIGSTGQPVDRPQNWYIAKSRSGQNSTTDFPIPGESGVSEVRNQIFHEEKGLVGSGDGTAMAFKGVIAVPRGMRRMREGDQIFIKLKNDDAMNDTHFCVKAIYKSLS